MNQEEESKTMCDCCAKEQEELIDISGGLCEQIVCTHNMKEEVVEPIRTKKRKHDADEEVFPTATEMVQSIVISFSNLPTEEVFQIMKAEKKTEVFNEETNECAHLTLKRKGEYRHQVVRTTKAIYKKLYEEEKYEKDCTRNNFYIMSKGVKLTSKKWNYLDFIILKKKKL